MTVAAFTSYLAIAAVCIGVAAVVLQPRPTGLRLWTWIVGLALIWPLTALFAAWAYYAEPKAQTRRGGA